MREALTSLTYKRLSAIIFAAGMPWGLSVPGQLMLLVGWLAQRPALKGSLKESLTEALRNVVTRSRDNLLVLVMNLLALWMMFTSFFALNKGTALGSSLMAVAVGWLCLSVIVPYVLQDQKMHTALLTAFVSSAAIASVVSLGQYDRGAVYVFSRASVWRAMGSNSLGNVMAISLLASALLSTRVRPRFRPLIGVAALLQLATLVLTFSRGSWLAMIAAAFVLLLCTRSRTAFAVVAAVITVFAISATLDPVLLQRIESITSLEANSDRLELFEAGILMIRDRPVTGFGINNIRDACDSYREPPFGDPMPFLHNVFIEFGATTGIPGLLLVTALIGGLLFIGVKSTVIRKAPLAVCVIFAMLVAQIVHLQVDIIIFAASAMPLAFVPAGILMRHYERAR